MSDKISKRRKLVLSGTDDIYAKREAAVEKRAPDDIKVRAAEAPKETQAPHPKLPRERRPPQDAHRSSQEHSEQPGKLFVNASLQIGQEVTVDLEKIASIHGLEVKDILKAARTRAAQKFLTYVKTGNKPPEGKIHMGGSSVRFSTTYSAEINNQLRAWYDPLNAGLVRSRIKPVLNQLLVAEIQSILRD